MAKRESTYQAIFCPFIIGILEVRYRNAHRASVGDDGCVSAGGLDC